MNENQCFGIFSVEGDYAILEDIAAYLENKGVEDAALWIAAL